MTHRMIDFYICLLQMNEWILLLGIQSSFITLKRKIHHFNSFWCNFSISVNGLYSFKANLTLFSTLSGHLLFFLYVCISKGNFQAKFDILTYISLNMLKENCKSCYQSVLCNAVWILKHCVENESSFCISFDKCYTILAKFKIS